MSVTFAPRFAERWEPAQRVLRRGTVVVLPGRGEHGEGYERLGRRLANDAYVVIALDVLPSTSVEDVVSLVASLQPADRPLVLLGSGTGAVEALQIAVLAGDVVSAVVAAGLPDKVLPESLTVGAFAGPVLVLNGDADPVTPLAEASAVATEIVQFLERVRLAPVIATRSA